MLGSSASALPVQTSGCDLRAKSAQILHATVVGCAATWLHASLYLPCGHGYTADIAINDSATTLPIAAIPCWPSIRLHFKACTFHSAMHASSRYRAQLISVTHKLSALRSAGCVSLSATDTDVLDPILFPYLVFSSIGLSSGKERMPQRDDLLVGRDAKAVVIGWSPEEHSIKATSMHSWEGDDSLNDPTNNNTPHDVSQSTNPAPHTPAAGYVYEQSEQGPTVKVQQPSNVKQHPTSASPNPPTHPYDLQAPASPATPAAPGPTAAPRTMRRNMLQTELAESVRRNLLWERQESRAQARAGSGRGSGRGNGNGKTRTAAAATTKAGTTTGGADGGLGALLGEGHRQEEGMGGRRRAWPWGSVSMVPGRGVPCSRICTVHGRMESWDHEASC